MRALPVGLAVLLTVPAATQEPAPARPPNVLLLLADDLGLGDIGACNPASRIPTPHLDRLAAAGLRCTDAHSASAVCTPSRYALLTGRYAWRTRLKSGVLWGDAPLLIEPDRATIASRLAAAGWSTAVFGKWHLGLGRPTDDRSPQPLDFRHPLDAGPHTVGFARSKVIPASLDIPPYVWIADGVAIEEPTAVTLGSSRRWSGGDGFWRAGPVAPSFDFADVLPATTRDTVAFLDASAATPDRPFFCYVPLSAPHTPWLPNAPFHRSSGAGWYGDFVAEVDHCVGRILTALDRSGRAADTLVVFTSDNGAHWRPQDVRSFDHDAHAGHRGMKADIHEAGHRVPLLVRWPGRVPAGGRTDALVGLVDLFATVLAAAGLEPRDGEAEDSISLLPLWTGATDAVRSELVCHSIDGTFALRQHAYKLIEGLGSGGFTAPARVAADPDGPAGQLYDLAADPGETRNLWQQQPERVAAMRARLDAIRAR